MASKEYYQEYYQGHKPEYRKRHNDLRHKRRAAGLCVQCGLPSTRWLCRACYNEGKLEYQIKYRQRIRDQVFLAYGGVFCRCCGETERDFLTMDHVNEDGARHRKEVTGTGAIYAWLKSHNFPPGFQVLCWNCNHSKHVHGQCVHNIKRETDGV